LRSKVSSDGGAVGQRHHRADPGGAVFMGI
jgi:hypothetical protein